MSRVIIPIPGFSPCWYRRNGRRYKLLTFTNTVHRDYEIISYESHLILGTDDYIPPEGDE